MKMPTSSQAMILRSGEGSERTRLSYTSLSPFSCRPGTKSNSFKLHTQSAKGNGELVKCDFSVSTSGDRSLDGFQGIFAYDQKTKSYRWQICSVLPKRSIDTPGNEMQGGDFINEDQFSEADIEHEEKVKASESYINRQSSEHTRHFMTPTVSLTDNSKYVINAATELHGKTRRLSSLTFPSDTETVDETSYRRLEELGFRHRTTYTSGGALIRLKQGEESPLTSPKKCRSDSKTEKDSPILTISNLDVCKVPKPVTAPCKAQGFKPKPIVTGDSMRKRVPPAKPKSLLQEVKESVHWDKRIAPPRLFGRGHPGYLPTTICFSLREGWKYTHAEIKRLVEDQLESQVKSLRYDPVSIRHPEEGMLDSWIVTFITKAQCDQAVQRGLAVDGDVVVVKAWDDVVRDEYVPEDELDWDYPCSFRLQSAKHKHVLRKFLQVN